LGDYSLQCALIYVVTYIGGFRISEAVVQAAARPRHCGCRARYTSHVQVYQGAIFIPPWRRRPIRKRV